MKLLANRGPLVTTHYERAGKSYNSATELLRDWQPGPLDQSTLSNPDYQVKRVQIQARNATVSESLLPGLGLGVATGLAVGLMAGTTGFLLGNVGEALHSLFSASPATLAPGLLGAKLGLGVGAGAGLLSGLRGFHSMRTGKGSLAGLDQGHAYQMDGRVWLSEPRHLQWYYFDNSGKNRDGEGIPRIPIG